MNTPDHGGIRKDKSEPLTMECFWLEQSILDKLESIQKKENIRTKTEALRRIIISYENMSKAMGL